jgi:hypothetical protein
MILCDHQVLSSIKSLVEVGGVCVFCFKEVLTECPFPGTLVKGEDEQDNLFVLDVLPPLGLPVHLPGPPKHVSLRNRLV